MSNATHPNPIQLKRPDPDACSPQESPAWRWCTAMYVSDPNCGNPPNSDDPWVQDAAEFLRQCRTGWSEGAIEPTEIQRIIAEAYALLADNKVRLAILQARLLAGETYDDIARHSGIPAAVVEAHEQLFFNVTNQTCLSQICGNLFQPKRVLQGLLPDRDIGSHLQMLARSDAAIVFTSTASSANAGRFVPSTWAPVPRQSRCTRKSNVSE